MNELRLQGWWCFKVHGSELIMSGIPDIICCAEGVFFGIETKMPHERDNTSARQDYVHIKIRQSSGQVFVACSPDEAVKRVRAGLIDHRRAIIKAQNRRRIDKQGE